MQNYSKIFLPIAAQTYCNGQRGNCNMFLSKRPNGIYHIYFKKFNGRMTSVSTKTKIKSEVNKFLVLFSKKLTGESGRKILTTTIESFTNELLRHSETNLPQKKDRLKE